MKDKPESSQTIDAAAAAWVARADKGPLSDDDVARLDAWLAGDARRQGAYARAQVIALHAQRARALGPHFATQRPKRDGSGLSTRRGFLMAGGALAASAVGGVALNLSLRGTAYATARGEVRRIPLGDGSAVTLNTDSRIVVSAGGRPRVRLHSGEALFDIAPGDDGPIVVSVDEAEAVTRAATFMVRRLEDRPVRLLVDAGSLDLKAGPLGSTERATVTANAAAEIDRHTGRMTVTRVQPEELTREQAWRNGKLAFQGQSLRDAAAEFARYGDPLIQIADPALADETVVGLFSLNDPEGFAQAVAASLDLTVRREDGRLVLHR